ncbi:MAG TPA: hypothetical protein VGE41_11110 [Verrucomicrobiae bacterium]|jgi:hypothetical protein
MGHGNQKTARFAAVLDKSGQPQWLTLWQKPAADPHFQKALKEDRILTVVRHRAGTGKDFGVVGFENTPSSSYLEFPKSLKSFDGKRIVGLNYNLAAPSEPLGKPVGHSTRPRRKQIRQVRRTEPPAKQFEVQFRITATIDQSVTVQAATAKEAERIAESRLNKAAFDFSRANVIMKPTGTHVMRHKD